MTAKYKHIQTRLTKDDCEHLKIIADHEDLTLADLVTNVLRALIANQQPALAQHYARMAQQTGASK